MGTAGGLRGKGAVRLALAAGLAAALVGCHKLRGEAQPGPFLPAPDQARAALESALAAWKDGQPDRPLSLGKTKVHVVDSYRDPKRPLTAFEILGPIAADRVRCLAVRVSLDHPAEEQVVRYYVFGEDPIWIFRQEDYERISHWEHKMEAVEPAEIPAAPSDPPSPSGA